MRFGGFFEGEFRVDGASEAVRLIPYVEGKDAFAFGASCRTGCAVEVGASRAFCTIGLATGLAVACGAGSFGGVLVSEGCNVLSITEGGHGYLLTATSFGGEPAGSSGTAEGLATLCNGGYGTICDGAGCAGVAGDDSGTVDDEEVAGGNGLVSLHVRVAEAVEEVVESLVGVFGDARGLRALTSHGG